ncbi:MAG: RNA polymerase sigma-70 factor, ECF subfamily [Parcubacteria group bacterium Licking1014_1]|nr:MAG: RNA polymerase sigma-70 factor, ECF subfamily [Parcubacteria group bacterium Licking1014_1]
MFLKGFETYKGQYPTSNTQHPIKNPGAFLYQIARNAVIDYYREKGRTKIVSVENAPQIADPSASLHDKAILNSDISIIKIAIQKLKKDYQDIIIWHYLDDMPIAEIAKTLDKPAGTVRVMLHRGLKALKKEIEEIAKKQAKQVKEA